MSSGCLALWVCSPRPPASHPRLPAVRAVPEPPGGLLRSRREGALLLLARETPGSSQGSLPSSPRTSRNPLQSGRKSKSRESAAQRTETTVRAVPSGSGERCWGSETKSFWPQLPLNRRGLVYSQFTLFLANLPPRDHSRLRTHVHKQNLAKLQFLYVLFCLPEWAIPKEVDSPSSAPLHSHLTFALCRNLCA